MLQNSIKHKVYNMKFYYIKYVRLVFYENTNKQGLLTRFLFYLGVENCTNNPLQEKLHRKQSSSL